MFSFIFLLVLPQNINDACIRKEVYKISRRDDLQHGYPGKIDFYKVAEGWAYRGIYPGR